MEPVASLEVRNAVAKAVSTSAYINSTLNSADYGLPPELHTAFNDLPGSLAMERVLRFMAA